jgi:hypothetical protein
LHVFVLGIAAAMRSLALAAGRLLAGLLLLAWTVLLLLLLGTLLVLVVLLTGLALLILLLLAGLIRLLAHHRTPVLDRAADLTADTRGEFHVITGEAASGMPPRCVMLSVGVLARSFHSHQ